MSGFRGQQPEAEGEGGEQLSQMKSKEPAAGQEEADQPAQGYMSSFLSKGAAGLKMAS